MYPKAFSAALGERVPVYVKHLGLNVAKVGTLLKDGDEHGHFITLDPEEARFVAECLMKFYEEAVESVPRCLKPDQECPFME